MFTNVSTSLSRINLHIKLAFGSSFEQKLRKKHQVTGKVVANYTTILENRKSRLMCNNSRNFFLRLSELSTRYFS